MTISPTETREQMLCLACGTVSRDEECDCTRNDTCTRRTVTYVHHLQARAEAAEAERDRLRAGIQAFLDGDYDYPRNHRPGECRHGTLYWYACEACDTEHFTKLLESK